jgi:hypothetical protein
MPLPDPDQQAHLSPQECSQNVDFVSSELRSSPRAAPYVPDDKRTCGFQTYPDEKTYFAEQQTQPLPNS